MKNSLLFLVLTLLTVTSCSKSKVIDNDSNNTQSEIGFSPYVNLNTKGEIIDGNTDWLTDGRVFRVFGFDQTQTESTVYMDSEVSCLDKIWSYSPIQYWPKNNKLDFFAVHETGTIKGEITKTRTSGLSFDYKVSTDISTQVDLMTAQSFDNSYETVSAVGGSVHLTFNHALSNIVIKAKTLHSLELYVNSLELKNFKSEGRFNQFIKKDAIKLTDEELFGQWSAQKSPVSYIPVLNVGPTTDITGETVQITDTENQLMLLPQEIVKADFSSGVASVSSPYIVISCKIKSNGIYLLGSQTEFKNINIALTPIKWIPGKRYVYTLVLGANGDGVVTDDGQKPLSPIGFETTIETWNDSTINQY